MLKPQQLKGIGVNKAIQEIIQHPIAKPGQRKIRTKTSLLPDRPDSLYFGGVERGMASGRVKEVPIDDTDSRYSFMMCSFPYTALRLVALRAGLIRFRYTQLPPPVEGQDYDPEVMKRVGAEQKRQRSKACGKDGPVLVFRSGFLKLDNFPRAMGPHQYINHNPGSYVMGNKATMNWVISKYRKDVDPIGYDFIPESFYVKKGEAASEEELRQRLSNKGKQESNWIIKPAAGSCGRGIVVAKGKDVPALIHSHFMRAPLKPIPLEAVEAELNSRTAQVAHQCVTVQEYLEPMLIHKRKFDFRIYVAILSTDPLVVVRHTKGLVRFAARDYSPMEPDGSYDKYAHLTNSSIKDPERGTESSQGDPLLGGFTGDGRGRKWSTSEFNLFLDQDTSGKYPSKDSFWADVDEAIRRTVIACLPGLAKWGSRFPKSRPFFELLGFDLMMDQQGKVHVIETNLSPSLRADSDMDFDVKETAVSDCLNMLMIPADLQDCTPMGPSGSFEEAGGRLLEKLEWRGGFVPVFPPPPGQGIAGCEAKGLQYAKEVLPEMGANTSLDFGQWWANGGGGLASLPPHAIPELA